MTKEQILQQISDTFDNLLITKPLTKIEIFDKIDNIFDKLLIKDNVVK